MLRKNREPTAAEKYQAREAEKQAINIPSTAEDQEDDANGESKSSGLEKSATNNNNTALTDEELNQIDSPASTFIDTQAWSFRFAFIGFALAVLAAAVPQYIYTVPKSVTFGMRATCYGDKCQGLDFSLLRSTLNCKGACDDALDQFRLRWRAVEGFSWMGVAFSMLLAALLRIGYTREIRATALGAPHVFISILIMFSYGVSLAIVGGSLSCGSGCFEYGASFICKLISLGVIVFCIPVGLLAARLDKHRATLARFAFGMIILSTAFEMAALLSNRWLFTTNGNTSGVLNAKSIGLFQTCVDGTCDPNNFDELLSAGATYGCTDKTGDGLMTRFLVGAIFHFITAATCLVLLVVAALKIKGIVRPIVVFLAFTFCTVANGLIFLTLDSWMFCGRTFCEVTSRTGTNTACEWGASAAFGLCLNICLGLLFVCEVVQAVYKNWCKEDETDSEYLLKTYSKKEIEARQAQKEQEEKEEAERHAKAIAEAQEKLRQEIAEKERKDQEEALQRKLAEEADAEEEEKEHDCEEAAAAMAAVAAAAAGAGAAATLGSGSHEPDQEQQQEEESCEQEHIQATSASAAAEATSEPFAATEEGEPLVEEENDQQQQQEQDEEVEEVEEEEEEEEEPAQQQELSVAEKVASGEFVSVKDRSAVFENSMNQNHSSTKVSTKNATPVEAEAEIEDGDNEADEEEQADE